MIEAVAGQCMPEAMTGLGGLAAVSNPLTSLGLMPGQPVSGEAGLPLSSQEAAPNAMALRRPGDCFADELPK